MKFLKRVLLGLLIFIGFIILLAASMVGAIDRTPLAEQDFYNEMMARLDTVQLKKHPAQTRLTAGWAKVNITPKTSMPMAGYMPRARFDVVHDSLYARMIVLDNGSFRCAMIDVDLLIFPPELRDRINEQMTGDNTFLYLSATHTHNGPGGWDGSIGGRLITGKYNEAWIEATATDIVKALKHVQLKESSFQYFESETKIVENRVDTDSGKVDNKLRGIRLLRSDSSKALLFTFSAHATSIQKQVLELSADYPGTTIRELEKENDFAMFMSGMVGSHRFAWDSRIDYEFMEYISPIIVSEIDSAVVNKPVDSINVRSARIPIEFGPAQLRIGKDWKLNNWAFRTLFRKLKGDLVYMEIGDVIFLGTPCDFSGEIYTVKSLEALAASRGKHLVITSFNGDYDGYITLDDYYDKSTKEEINALNWVGPYHGDYFTQMITKLLSK